MRRRKSVKTFTWDCFGWGERGEMNISIFGRSFMNSLKCWQPFLLHFKLMTGAFVAPQLCMMHVCILTPWFSHPVSLWHWGHTRAAWQQWLSAWFGPSAWQTFPVLCGEGSHTSVAIPIRGKNEKKLDLHIKAISKHVLDSLHSLEYIESGDTGRGQNKDGEGGDVKKSPGLKSHPGHFSLAFVCHHDAHVCSDDKCVKRVLCASHQKQKSIK